MPRTTIKELREKIEALEKEKEELQRKAENAKAQVIGRMMSLLAVEIGRPYPDMLAKAFPAPSLKPGSLKVPWVKEHETVPGFEYDPEPEQVEIPKPDGSNRENTIDG